jgi:hypothetical protein
MDRVIPLAAARGFGSGAPGVPALPHKPPAEAGGNPRDVAKRLRTGRETSKEKAAVLAASGR